MHRSSRLCFRDAAGFAADEADETTSLRIHTTAPQLVGQASATILREMLGLDDEQLAALAGAGIIGDRPIGA